MAEDHSKFENLPLSNKCILAIELKDWRFLDKNIRDYDPEKGVDPILNESFQKDGIFYRNLVHYAYAKENVSATFGLIIKKGAMLDFSLKGNGEQSQKIRGTVETLALAAVSFSTKYSSSNFTRNISAIITGFTSDSLNAGKSNAETFISVHPLHKDLIKYIETGELSSFAERLLNIDLGNGTTLDTLPSASHVQGFLFCLTLFKDKENTDTFLRNINSNPEYTVGEKTRGR